MPGDWEALLAADRLADLGQTDQAETRYRALLAAAPDWPELRHRLGALLLQTDRLEEAAEQCRRAIGIRPRYPTALNTLGVALSRSGDHAAAIAALEAALAAEPGYAKAAFNLGQALDQCGRRVEAIAAYRHALELDPGLELANFELAALGELPPPARMPPAYVVHLFDGYAARFDAHLAELNYAVPQLLLEAVSRLQPGGFGRTVDLGCGTGLVGACFRSRAEHLAGIDLAPAMIAAAARRGVYDALIQAEVVDWLAADAPACGADSSGDVDLLLAADLLIYLGDLKPLFVAARRRLRAGALLAFSLERSDRQDYLLQPTRRYAHSVAYIRRLAAEHDWSVVSCSAALLRNQGPEGTPGVIFVLQAGVN